MTTPTTQREAVARLIDPKAWADEDWRRGLVKTRSLSEDPHSPILKSLEPSLTKADAILALLAKPQEGATATKPIETVGDAIEQMDAAWDKITIGMSRREVFDAGWAAGFDGYEGFRGTPCYECGKVEFSRVCIPCNPEMFGEALPIAKPQDEEDPYTEAEREHDSAMAEASERGHLPEPALDPQEGVDAELAAKDMVQINLAFVCAGLPADDKRSVVERILALGSKIDQFEAAPSPSPAPALVEEARGIARNLRIGHWAVSPTLTADLLEDLANALSAKDGSHV